MQICTSSAQQVETVVPAAASMPTPEEFGIGQLFWDVHEAIVAAETATGRIVLWSPAAVALFGYTVEEALTLTVDVLVPPSLKDLHHTGIHRYHATGEGALVGSPTAVQVPSLTKAGKDLVIELSLTRLRTPHIAGSFVLALVRDVTARVAAEECARRSEARFESLVQHASDMIVILDRDGAVRYASPATERIVGQHVEAIAGSVPFVSWFADRAAKVRQRVYAVAPASTTAPFDLRIRHHDGSWRDIEVVVTNLLEDPDVGGIVINARDITDRKQSERQLLHLAGHDALTGLYNRRRFVEEVENDLARARRVAAPGALLFIDLDGFKQVNDSLGHRVGDDLLIGLALKLRAALRESDRLGRLGGDEFAVFLPQTEQAQAEQNARRLLETVRQHGLVLGSETIRITASIGIALFPSQGTSAESLLIGADMAMYQAKEQHDQYATHDPRLRSSSLLHEQRLWESRLREAAERDLFVLHAQPIRSLHTGTEQYELLLRLPDHDGTLILPGEFLPIAERSGLIRVIDRWVVRRAIALLATCTRAGRNVCFEVNLSGKSLADPELLALIQGDLERTGIDPSRLVLEITETAAIADLGAARDFIAALKARGCRFAIDDFGVGFASFAYLKHLPVDYLKIDGSFIRDLPRDIVDQHLVKAMVEVARVGEGNDRRVRRR